MEHTKPTEIVAEQMHRVQEWLGAHDWKSWFRRLRPGAPDEAVDSSHFAKSETLANEAHGNEPRTRFIDREQRRNQELSRSSELSHSSEQNRSAGPTHLELERLENDRISLHSLVFLDDSDLEEIFEPTVHEETRFRYEDESVSASRETIGDELAKRMLRSATGNDPETHH